MTDIERELLDWLSEPSAVTIERKHWEANARLWPYRLALELWCSTVLAAALRAQLEEKG